ncbi:glycosyltransferase [Tenacibaculum agarivorans]|uniref:glycosyltransferase n=1 Tax=Tenacibaculum agarivorans TaxID=1908389 RepID=UPI00094B9282|nr:glycosyltransferase [Tenacibaculum agarivorans]
MKIVHVIDQLGLGGAERVCVNLVNLLHRNGNKVKLIVLNNAGSLFDLIDDGVEVIRLDKKAGKFRAYKQFKKFVQNDDIIHIHMRANYRFVRKAFLFFGGKKPLILHDHFGKIEVDTSIKKFYTIFKPNLYIGVSNLLTNWATTKMKMNKNKVFLMHNFVHKYLHKEDVVIPEEKEGIVLVASLKAVKNHIFAVQLAKRLNLPLTIYCQENRSSEYFKNLEKDIKKEYDTNKVRFIYNHNNVQSELYKYNFAVCTSKSESGPLVLLEFLAQGIPFLTFETGEVTSFVKSKFPDFVIDNFDLEKWEQRSKTLNQYNSKELSEAFNSYLEDQNFVEKYLELYQLIIK